MTAVMTAVLPTWQWSLWLRSARRTTFRSTCATTLHSDVPTSSCCAVQLTATPSHRYDDYRLIVSVVNIICITGIRQDSGCPLCQEEDDTTVHLIPQCSALMLLRKAILGNFTLPLDTLSDIHWHLLLRFAKASKRFYRPWGLSRMCTGPAMWPQRWVPA